MHATTLLLLADQKIAEYRREADDHRLASQALRAPRYAPVAAPMTRHTDRRPTVSRPAMHASEADC
jgi:hypothetical protein